MEVAKGSGTGDVDESFNDSYTSRVLDQRRNTHGVNGIGGFHRKGDNHHMAAIR